MASAPSPGIARPFVCAGCDRHMVSLGAEPPDPTRCSACQCFPGWHLDPRMRAIMGLCADPAIAERIGLRREAVH